MRSWMRTITNNDINRYQELDIRHESIRDLLFIQKQEPQWIKQGYESKWWNAITFWNQDEEQEQL